MVAWPAIVILVNEWPVFKRNTKHAFAPGLRLLVLDMTILTVGVTAVLAFATAVWWCGFMFGFMLGHFFLFCNVVRMARPLELAWTAVFVALAAAKITIGTPGWRITVLVSLFATAVVAVVQIRNPSYHGLGCGGSIQSYTNCGNLGSPKAPTAKIVLEAEVPNF